MNTQHSSRVALVTGASGGIGGAVATRLAADGFDVVVHYAGNEAPAAEIAEAVEAEGRRAVTVQADVADEVAMRAVFDAAEELGGLDVVVNTAGIMILSPVTEFDLDDLDRMHRTNIRGAFVTTQLAAQRIRRGGAIINFSTSQTRLQGPTYAGYTMTKAAVEALTLTLARELAGQDITVNTVAPGPTATPLFLDGKPQELLDRIAGASPFGRLGEPDDIAEVVSSLAGPARWINGQTIFVNGGVA